MADTLRQFEALVLIPLRSTHAQKSWAGPESGRIERSTLQSAWSTLYLLTFLFGRY
jgi:hypothetical protein